MAEAALSFAVEKLGDLLIEKVVFLRGVEGQVRWLKDELQRMQFFLQDAADKQANDKSVRKWISDIREMAQDAEDVIETFDLKVESPRRRRGLLERLACFPNHAHRLYRVGEEIESIRARLRDIESSRQTYGIQNLGEGMMDSRFGEDVEWRRRLAPWQKDKHVVGLEGDVQKLLRNAILEETEEGLCVAGVVGMGGIGKSTLARKVYNHRAVADRFDCRAWVVVSSVFRPMEIIKELVLQVLEPGEDKLTVLETMEKLPVPSLQQMLHERLRGRRYFIVLDDVWEDQHWESLANAFPDEDKASRLLVTSRNRVVAKYARYVHEMKLLDPKQCWELFLKKAFIDDTECPEYLEGLGREIVKKCDGLPLAIIMMGGVLVKQRQSTSEWEKVLKRIDSHMGRSKNSVLAILELSYHNLSPQLKSCFLCLGFFKEDATIRAKKLVQVWIAEGLVPQDGQGETMEETSTSYLDELINRNMVQVKDMSKDDRVKNCHIHDLLRELSIRKAKEEINFEILRDEGDPQFSDKHRHRAIYYSGEKFIYSKNQNKHVHSLFFHGGSNIVQGSPSYWKSFELLRVIDFEDLRLEILPETIGELIGLSYLGLRNTRIRKLPLSLGRLKNLQVLDISCNYIAEVPDVVWKMDSLRHLYVDLLGCQIPLKIDTLKNLQTLTYIFMSDWVLECSTKMTSLRNLGIRLEANSDVRKLFSSLAVLENLVCLNLTCYALKTDLSEGLGILNRVTQLKVHGRMIRLPSVNYFPPNLSFLSLVQTLLDKDPMSVLEKLPKLLYLKLDNAYPGHSMVISHDGFPKLKVLSLRDLRRLRNIQVGEGGMAELERFEMDECHKTLERNLPEELRRLVTNSYQG